MIIVFHLSKPSNLLSDDKGQYNEVFPEAHRPVKNFSKLRRRLAPKFPYLVENVDRPMEFSGDVALGGGETLKIAVF